MTLKPDIPKAKSINREDIQKENRALARELWQGKLTERERKAVNNLCILYGLDPLQRQLLVLGGNFYITVAGLKKVAEDSDNPPQAIQVVPATRAEREEAGITKNDPDKGDYVHFWRAALYKKDSPLAFIEFGEASTEDVNIHGKQDKDIRAMARTRAAGRVLRNAYSVGFPLAEEAPLDLGVIEGEIVPEKEPREQVDKSKSSGDNATQPQIGLIHKLLDEKGVTEADYRGGLEHEYGVKSSKELTKEQASQLIDNLNKRKDVPKEAQPEAEEEEIFEKGERQ